MKHVLTIATFFSVLLQCYCFGGDAPQKLSNTSNGFPKGSITFSYEDSDGKRVERKLHPADHPVALNPDGSVRYILFNSDSTAQLNEQYYKGTTHGIVAGLGMAALFGYIASSFIPSRPSNNNARNN